MTGLRPLMAPRSVAVIGASEDATRIGGRTLAMIRRTGFAGPIHPVNPRRARVQDLPAFPSVAAIPGDVDCAIICIPADQVTVAMRDCAAKGVGAAIVFSAGFAELHAEGRAMQEEMARIARAGGMRVLGPNCTGCYNLDTGAYLSFYDAGVRGMVRGRNVGIVSQSGGYGAHIVTMARQRGLSVGHWVTTGNECDIELGEVLAAFAGDPAVNVLVGYVEGIRDADSFLRALDLARTNRKPVILMKSGRTERGALAAASHTASLAGFDAAYEAVFREFGVHRANSTEEVLDVAYAAASGRLPPDRRVAIMTNSGGMGVQIADYAAETRLALPELPPAAQAKILGIVPNGAARNPVDFTAQWLAEPHLIPGCLAVLLGDCDFQAVICFMGSSGSNPVVLDGIAPVLARHPGRLVVMCISVDAECAQRFEAIGCLVFEEPARAMRAIAALAGFAESFAREPRGAPGVAAPRLAADVRLNEAEAKHVLAACGVMVPTEVVAASPDDAARAAASIGFPVCLKILSPDIPHKTELGGVALDLGSADAVHAAAAGMAARIGVRRPDARIDGFLVGPMLRGGVECIIGVHRDALFGPIVMVGLGGVGVELLKDIAWRRAPLDQVEAARMLDELALAPLLAAHRSRPAMDRAALTQAIVAIAALAAANADHVRTIEVNPILVLPEGGGAVALDAVIETE